MPVERGRGGSTESGDDPARRAVTLEWAAIGDIAVLGPLFTMLLVATGHPRGGLIGVAAFAFFGVAGLALQPSVDRAERSGRNGAATTATAAMAASQEQARRPAALIALALIASLSAAVVAAIEISTVAAADRYGHHALSGLFLALAAVGCVVGGLWKGWQKLPAHRCLMVALLLVAIATALLWLAPNLRAAAREPLPARRLRAAGRHQRILDPAGPGRAGPPDRGAVVVRAAASAWGPPLAWRSPAA